MGRRVLITGVSGFWGTELARRLERSPEVEYIAGLDVRPPAADLARTEFIRADIRNPLISKLLPQTEVDTVVHCDVLLVPEPGKAPEQLHDINVIGSLQLLAACEKTETVRTIVVRGSSAIYGAEPNAPEFFTEDMARRFPFRTRFQRDIGELESYFENFSRRFAQVTVTTLRYQPTLGTAIDSPLTRYLQPAGGSHPARLRPAAAVRARRGRGRRARGGGHAAGARAGQRGRRRAACRSAGCCGWPGKVPLPIPAPLFSAALGDRWARSASARLPPEAVPWLRNGAHDRRHAAGSRRSGSGRARRWRRSRTSSRSCTGDACCPACATAATGSATDRNGGRARARARA